MAAVGRTKGSYEQISLSSNTNLTSVSEFKDLIIREDGDRIVRLSDVADVILGAEDYDTDVRFGGEQAVFMGVWVMPNANSLDVINRVEEEINAMQSRFPVGFTGGVAYDATEYIDTALKEVVTTLAETLAIVVVVIFLFLGSIRSVLVPVLAIPVSLIGGVFLMQSLRV